MLRNLQGNIDIFWKLDLYSKPKTIHIIYVLCLIFLLSQTKQKSQEVSCKSPICKDSPLKFHPNMQDAIQPQECPLTRGELGRYAWSLVHTVIAYYPQSPSAQDQKYLLSFLEGFANTYPCMCCRGYFKKDFEEDPPNQYLSDHEAINLWICRQHNRVNKMIGSPEFECSYQKIMKRWKTGCTNGDKL